MTRDLKLHNYQDDLDNKEDNSTVDDFTHQQTGELSEESGVSREALQEEFGKLDVDRYEDAGTSASQGSDPSAADAIEDIEDRDEDSSEAR